MNKARIVFDTNVLVSAALIKHSVSRRAFDLARKEGDILVSAETLEELQIVLKRDKFKKYLNDAERKLFLAIFSSEATTVQVTETLNVCRDPKDDKFLELALSGKATLIISGDEDLLVLNPFRDISILPPHKFLE